MEKTRSLIDILNDPQEKKKRDDVIQEALNQATIADGIIIHIRMPPLSTYELTRISMNYDKAYPLKKNEAI